MNQFAIVLILLAACGNPDLEEKLATLKAPTVGHLQRSKDTFASLSQGGEDGVMPSKEEALAWLDTLDHYDPIPHNSFVARQLVLDYGDDKITLPWLESHEPEIGVVFPPLVIVNRVIATGEARGFTAAEWATLRRVTQRYAERATAGPVKDITLVTAQAMLTTVARVKRPVSPPNRSASLSS